MEQRRTLADVQAMCRLCTRKQASMHDVYAVDSSEDNKSLSQLITWLTHLPISVDDGLPGSACSQCVLQLNGALQFVNQCLASDQQLREIVAQLTETEIVDPGEVLHEVTISVDPDPLEETGVHRLLKSEVMEVVPDQKECSNSGGDDYDDPGHRSHPDGPGHRSDPDYEPAMGDDAAATNLESEIALPKTSGRRGRKPKTETETAPGQPAMHRGRPRGSKTKYVAARRSYPRTTASNPSCNICALSFDTKPLLAAHMDTHKTPGRKCHQCPSCLHVYPSLKQLEKHLVVLTGGKPFTCELCDSYFSRADSLKKHVRIHTGETPYQCAACPKAFSHPWSLTVHRRSHLGERPHKCETCGRGFCERKALRKHTCKGPGAAGVVVKEEEEEEDDDDV